MANKVNHTPVRGPRSGSAIISGNVNPWLSLAQGVVYQAVLDWRAMNRGKEFATESYSSLRRFFLSPWCDSLLVFTDINPIELVDILEAERNDRS